MYLCNHGKIKQYKIKEKDAKKSIEAYLADEEEDLYWSQGAIDMIESIGKQNWLFTQV